MKGIYLTVRLLINYTVTTSRFELSFTYFSLFFFQFSLLCFFSFSVLMFAIPNLLASSMVAPLNLLVEQECAEHYGLIFLLLDSQCI